MLNGIYPLNSIQCQASNDMVEERDERFDYRHRPSGLVQWHLMAVHVVRIKWDGMAVEWKSVFVSC